MAYYNQGEGGETYMGFLFAGSVPFTERNFTIINKNKNQFLNIIKKYWVDIEASRKEGKTCYNGDNKDLVIKIGFKAECRGLDLDFNNFICSHGNYLYVYINIHLKSGLQRLSAHESLFMEKEARSLLDELIKQQESR